MTSLLAVSLLESFLRAIFFIRTAFEVFGRISGDLDMSKKGVHFRGPPLSLQTSDSIINLYYFIDKVIQWDYKGGSTTRPVYKINIIL